MPTTDRNRTFGRTLCACVLYVAACALVPAALAQPEARGGPGHGWAEPMRGGHEQAAGDIERNPAVVTDNARDPGFYDDYLRITFVPAAVDVTTPGRPSALRAFFGATRFYEPPLPVYAIADFNGFAPDPARDLVAMVCRPRSAAADPRYHTWPNLAKMIVADLGARGYACPAPAGADDSNAAYCLALEYRDVPAKPVVDALVAALQFAQRLYALSSGNWLYDNYGIGYDNTGLGMVVRGPAILLNAGQALEQSVVPEYLLKNVSLATANCRCVRVPPYEGRDQDLLPPRLVWDRGHLAPDGKCTAQLRRLPDGSR